MGVQFNAYDSERDVLLGKPVDMSRTTAARLDALLGLRFVTASTADGTCSQTQLRSGLERWPDGHHDELINQRLGELLQLLLTAEKYDHDVLITWG